MAKGLVAHILLDLRNKPTESFAPHSDCGYWRLGLWVGGPTRINSRQSGHAVNDAGHGACNPNYVQNDRLFDYLDIVANLVGSLAALSLCAIYHKRMLERKRAAKSYQSVPGDEEANVGDVELDENIGPQETGVTSSGQRETNLDEELDNWDENAADDWDEDVPPHVNGNTTAGDEKSGDSKPPADVGKNKRAD